MEGHGSGRVAAILTLSQTDVCEKFTFRAAVDTV